MIPWGHGTAYEWGLLDQLHRAGEWRGGGRWVRRERGGIYYRVFSKVL